MKATASIYVALWLMGARLATAQTPEDEVERRFHAGQQALQQGQFAAAVEDFNKVLALDPTLIEADVNLGLAYQGLLEYDSATRHLTKALKQRPELLGPTVIVGMDYLKLGEPEKGIPFLQRALKMDPSNLEAHEALASSYLSQDNFRDAAEQFRQIAALTTDKADAWYKLGHEYLDLAARLAFRGAHLYSDSAWGHRFLGDLMFQRDRWDEALKEYQKALAADPQQPGLHASLGQAYLHAQKLDEAEKEFRLELQLGVDTGLAWLGLANTQLARGHAEDALASLAKAWEVSPEFVAVQRDFPSIELSPDSAKASVTAVQNQPESPAKHFLLASLLALTNQAGLTDREWKSFQADFLAWQQTAQAVPAAADQESCQTHRYARCISALGGRKDLKDSERLQLGEAEFILQQYQSAADTLAKVRGTSTENVEASYWLERTYQAQGAETYAQLDESFSTSWRAHQLRAEGFAFRGYLPEALKEFQAALAMRPNEPQLHEALGELFLEHTENDDAEKELKQTLVLDPSRTHALYLLGRVYVEEKENEKAVPYLERAVRLQPDLAEANSLLGTAYLRLGRVAEAIAKLEKAAASDHYGNVHYQLSVAYRKLGQPERARRELVQSQQLRKSYLQRDEALIMGSPQPEAEPQ